MEKRLTVDLPEEAYKELLKVQYERAQTEPKRVSLGELIRQAVLEWIENKHIADKK